MKAEKIIRPERELEDTLRDENSQVVHYLQSLLMNTSLSGHTEATSHPPTPSAHFLPRKLRGEPANKRLWLPELQVEEAKKVRAGLGSPYQVGGMRL